MIVRGLPGFNRFRLQDIKAFQNLKFQHDRFGDVYANLFAEYARKVSYVGRNMAKREEWRLMLGIMLMDALKYAYEPTSTGDSMLLSPRDVAALQTKLNFLFDTDYWVFNKTTRPEKYLI